MDNEQLKMDNYPLSTINSPLRKGYKQTEVGVIPEEWEVNQLGEIASIKTGPFGSALHERDYVQEGTPIITVEHLDDFGVLHSNLPMVSEPDKRRLSAYTLELDDIVFSRVGAIDRNALIRQAEVGWLFSGRLLRVRLNSGNLFAPYLSYHFHDTPFKLRVKSVAVGQTMASLNTQILRGIDIVLPPLPEQRAIAGALSDVDALIGALDQLIAKKRDLKQAAMQQLLTGQKRIPGFHGEWEVKRLGDVGNCLRGVTYKGDSDLSPYDTAHTKRLLRSNNIQNATVVTTDIQFVNAAQVSENQVLREDDILICMANGSKALVGKAGLFRVSDGYEYTFGAFMGCFRSNTVESNSTFVFSLFQTGRYRNHINNLLAGSSINNLRPNSIESLEFPIPPLPEQAAIAEVLSDMDAELAALKQRRDKTRALKQGMMQELLTGRVRLTKLKIENG